MTVGGMGFIPERLLMMMMMISVYHSNNAHESVALAPSITIPGLNAFNPRSSCLPLTCLQSCLPEDKHSKAQWWYPVLKIGCGSAAAMTAQAVSYPLDTLRRRMQVNGSQGTSVHYRWVGGWGVSPVGLGMA